MNFPTILLIGVGGFIGTISRFVVVQLVDTRIATNFPYGTLLVNLSGCFLIGLIYGMNLRDDMISKNWKLFLTTGFCGGYTTFSAFALENVVLFQQRLIPPALLYISVSLVGGMIATTLGAVLGRTLNS